MWLIYKRPSCAEPLSRLGRVTTSHGLKNVESRTLHVSRRRVRDILTVLLPVFLSGLILRQQSLEIFNF